MKRILLIDDNEPFRLLLGRTLQNAGYEVQTASEGSAALKCFQKTAFDLVITDLIMPGKEGLETIIELRQIQPGLKIIAMSGGGRCEAGEYLPMAQGLGATQTLVKPFSQQEILEAVASHLNADTAYA